MNDALALPLTIGANGLFARVTTADAVAQLIGVMSSTSSGFWPHAPWFGLLELFENAKTDVQDLPRITDAINIALKELGCDAVRVQSVRNPGGEQYGSRHFDIALADTDGNLIFRQIKA